MGNQLQNFYENAVTVRCGCTHRLVMVLLQEQRVLLHEGLQLSRTEDLLLQQLLHLMEP
jgi:hypothetical protein